MLKKKQTDRWTNQINAPFYTRNERERKQRKGEEGTSHTRVSHAVAVPLLEGISWKSVGIVKLELLQRARGIYLGPQSAVRAD